MYEIINFWKIDDCHSDLVRHLSTRPGFWERARRRKHARRKARPRDSLKPGLGATPVSKALFYQSSMAKTMHS